MNHIQKVSVSFLKEKLLVEKSICYAIIVWSIPCLLDEKWLSLIKMIIIQITVGIANFEIKVLMLI